MDVVGRETSVLEPACVQERAGSLVVLEDKHAEMLTPSSEALELSIASVLWSGICRALQGIREWNLRKGARLQREKLCRFWKFPWKNLKGGN